MCFFGFLLFGAISLYFYYADTGILLFDAIFIPGWVLGIPTFVIALYFFVMSVFGRCA